MGIEQNNGVQPSGLHTNTDVNGGEPEVAPEQNVNPDLVPPEAEEQQQRNHEVKADVRFSCAQKRRSEIDEEWKRIALCEECFQFMQGVLDASQSIQELWKVIASFCTLF